MEFRRHVNEFFLGEKLNIEPFKNGKLNCSLQLFGRGLIMNIYGFLIGSLLPDK